MLEIFILPLKFRFCRFKRKWSDKLNFMTGSHITPNPVTLLLIVGRMSCGKNVPKASLGVGLGLIFLADRTYGRAYMAQVFHKRSVIVLIVTAVMSSTRRPIVTMSLSAAVWQQFSMQSCCYSRALNSVS